MPNTSSCTAPWKQTVLIGLLLLIFPPAAFARDDFQYRQLLTFKVIDTQKADFLLFNQLRLNHDAQDVGFYSITPQLKFDLWKNLQLGLNYTYLNTKVSNTAAGRDEFRFHHRVELDASPHWDIGDLVTITLRNRYEFRWIENNGSHNPRLRHRTNLEFPLKNVLPLQSVYTNSEFFYDLNDHRYMENWTVPFGLKFKVTKQTNFSVFYMVQSRLTDTWTSAQILGTHVLIDF